MVVNIQNLRSKNSPQRAATVARRKYGKVGYMIIVTKGGKMTKTVIKQANHIPPESAIENMSFLDDNFNPVDKEHATLVEIVYVDGSVVFAVPEKVQSITKSRRPVIVTL